MTNRKIIMGGTIALLMSTSSLHAQVTCTATPDCNTLGYNKTAANCPGSSVKCPFNSNWVFCLNGGGGNNFSIKNKVNNLDIVYSDGTTASTLNTAKDAIGVALVFETNSGYNHGIIISAHQPPATTWANAVKRCKDYVVKGTSEGDWRLPTFMEMVEINGWETESSTGTNQYANLNNKMKLLPQAEQLGYSYLYNYCNSGANDYGGTYLKESPNCTTQTKSTTCSTSGTCTGSVSVPPNQCPTDWQVLKPCNVYQPSYNNYTICQSPQGQQRQQPCTTVCSSCTVTKSCNAGFGSIPATNTLTSNYYWTMSETPDNGAYPYYFKLGATNQEKVIKGDSSSKNKKLLYRCVMTF